MADYELDPMQAEEADAEALECAPVSSGPRWKRVLKRIGIGLGVLVLLLVVAGFALYNFGGMGSSANDPAMKQGYEKLVASGQVPPVQKRFVIPIPGCTCHSTDPVQTEVHRYYRMNECSKSGCHG